MFFLDMYPIPPILSSAALFIPPPDRNIQKSSDCNTWMIQGKKSEFAHTGLDFIWGENIDISINYFQELKVQKTTTRRLMVCKYVE